MSIGSHRTGAALLSVPLLLHLLLPAGSARAPLGAPPPGGEERLRLTEVFPDPPGPDGRGAGEWVEIQNRGDTPVDLSGWRIGDRSDPADRILPWREGTPAVLGVHGFALIVDPDSDPAGMGLAPGVLLLKPDDGSIGNGLRADGERLHLVMPDGTVADTVRWRAHAGEGVSWERVGSPDAGGSEWRPCRAPAGATPGRPNSWTPVPGDRAVRWRSRPDRPLDTLRSHTLRAVVRDEGGAGLADLDIRVAATLGSTAPGTLLERRLPWISPFDSVEVIVAWRPRDGGSWRLSVEIARPPIERGWHDSDSLLVAVSFPLRARVLTEAMPRPLQGEPEWLELWDGSPPAAARNGEGWAGWRLRVRSLAAGSKRARTFSIPELEEGIVVVVPGEAPPAGYLGGHAPAGAALATWHGLRLADEGSAVVLVDPTGAVVDSSVLRPVAALPRGHSLQRHRPWSEGWIPAAWRISLTPQGGTPGWYEPPGGGARSGGGSGDERPGGFRLRIVHEVDGAVRFEWDSPAERLWLEGRLFDLSGRPVATPLPRVLLPGSDAYRWQARAAAPPVPPGIYVLVFEVEDADGSSRWSVKRPLGVRP